MVKQLTLTEICKTNQQRVFGRGEVAHLIEHSGIDRHDSYFSKIARSHYDVMHFYIPPKVAAIKDKRLRQLKIRKIQKHGKKLIDKKKRIRADLLRRIRLLQTDPHIGTMYKPTNLDIRKPFPNKTLGEIDVRIPFA